MTDKGLYDFGRFLESIYKQNISNRNMLLFGICIVLLAIAFAASTNSKIAVVGVNSTTITNIVNTSSSINISQIVNMSYWNAIQADYTAGHGNGTILIAPTGADSKRNTSFIDSSLWNSAGVYQAIGVSEFPLENNASIGGYIYNYSVYNSFAVTLTRAGSILHTTQVDGNTSTMTQDPFGWKFDWGVYNSTLGRRENRIAIETSTYKQTGIQSGLNMGGRHIVNSPDLSMIWSTGVTSGGNISYDAVNNNIVITGGVVALRDNNTDISDLNEYVFYGRNFSINMSATEYIYVKYNGTSPPVLMNTTNFGDIDGRTAVSLYLVQKESEAELHWISAKGQNVGLGLKLRRMLYDTNRFAHGGGAAVGSGGALNLTITTGKFYYGLNYVETMARNTSTGDTLEYYFINGSNYTSNVQYQVNNTYYDNNGVPTLMTNNKFKVDWIFLELSNNPAYDSEFAAVMGQNQYNTFAEAETEKVPSNLPTPISAMGVIVGRVIIQKSATVPHSIESSFAIQFTPSLATDHNLLSNLQGGTTNEYYHMSASQYSEHTTSPGNLTILTPGYGIILKSPDGTKCGLLSWSDADTFVTRSVTCP